MQHLEVSCAVRHIYIYIYVVIRLRVKEHQAYFHNISRKTNLSLYHTMCTVEMWWLDSRNTRNSHQVHAAASLFLGGAVPCTYYLNEPQSRPEREFRTSAGKEHLVSVRKGTFRHAHETVTDTGWHIPDVVLIRLILLMMSKRLLETCTYLLLVHGAESFLRS
jgi:hypothetical protein